MKSNDLTARLLKIIEPIAQGRDLEIVDVELTGTKSGRLLRITIERPDGSATISDCTGLSRELSATLDVEDPIDGNYTLEVSTPGIERPLKRRRDFERFAGETVAVFFEEDGRQREARGRLEGIDADDYIGVDTKSGVAQIPFENVSKAQIVFDFGRKKR